MTLPNAPPEKDPKANVMVDTQAPSLTSSGAAARVQDVEQLDGLLAERPLPLELRLRQLRDAVVRHPPVHPAQRVLRQRQHRVRRVQLLRPALKQTHDHASLP